MTTNNWTTRAQSPKMVVKKLDKAPATLGTSGGMAPGGKS